MSWTIIGVGDTREIVQSLDTNSVQTIITSPPYYGLRDYGVEGQIGLEPTPQEYVDGLVNVFRECRRVLKQDGTFWLNIGDSYAANRTYQVSQTKHKVHDFGKSNATKVPEGCKPKDLIRIPWMLAFALRDDGWYLRSDIIWHKPNALPESVRDRPTSSYEHMFLLAKSEKYFYDAQAVKETAVGGHIGAAGTFKRNGSKREQTLPGQAKGTHRPDRPDVNYDAPTRNLRNIWDIEEDEYEQFLRWKATSCETMDLWSINTKPFKGAHFATFPTNLIEPCVKAGSPADGIVLDPFAGSGTTALVANRLDRNAILLEINPDYAKMAYSRLIESGIDPDTIHVA